MRRFSFIAVAFLFAAISAVPGFGQVPAATTPAKIVVINTSAFDSKEGIVKYSNAMNALETEFKPAQTEIQTMMTRYQTLATEIENARKANPAVPINPSTIQTKVDEAQGLEINIKRKQEDGKVRFEKRQQQVLAPILQDIMKAMDDFAKQKGYALILDAAKLEGAGLILAVDLPKVDVTKDFITFYNARPATTASTATPR
ncbi:MAG TPA: OmpH family outer membrane protein [Pyrinomonadaceae bacterium]|nr:OmpH family outer membrane protein [Pyrinomonadaceae bacterium]